MDVSLEWRLLAQTGLTTQQIREQLYTLEPQSVDCVVVSAGVNDVTSTLSPRIWIRHINQLLEHLRQKLKVQHILVIPVPAMQHFPALPFPLNWYLGQRAANFNRRLAKFVNLHPDLELLPSLPLLHPSWMAADGFHPGAEGYQQWASQLHQCIRARWLDADS
jgi:lysophospholipase L1-like esterase